MTFGWNIQRPGKPEGVKSVEIKTGERRLVEFFLSPFTRQAREALRER